MLKQAWSQMVISQCGPPAILPPTLSAKNAERMGHPLLCVI
jgi:hypothetical protein